MEAIRLEKLKYIIIFYYSRSRVYVNTQIYTHNG
jgi:hypothetical protein